MTETQTAIDHVSGPVHTGSGSLHNYVVIPLAQGTLRLQPFLQRELGELWDRFVPPQGFSEAQSMWNSKGPIIVLSGRPGSGRETAARMLLYRGDGSEQASMLHELPVVESEDEHIPLNTEHIRDDDRLLLNLSGLGDHAFTRYQRELLILELHLAEVRAVAVMVIDEDQSRLLTDRLKAVCSALERPAGADVLRRHLDVVQLPVPADFPDQRRLDIFVARAGLRELAHMAELAKKQRSLDVGGCEWLRSALDAVTDYPREMDRLLGDHPDGAARALLLVVAIFEGSAVEVIARGQRLLLANTTFSASSNHWLEQRGLLQCLADLKALPQPDRTVHFSRPEFGRAVLHRYWDEYPDRREEVMEWLSATITDDATADADAAKASVRLADQLIRIGDSDLLIDLAGRQRTPSILCHVLLALGALDARCGRRVRQQLYSWATRTDLSADLAHVVARVCGEELAAAYPSQAIVRLRHLTRHSDESVKARALEVLVELTQDGRMLARAFAVLARARLIEAELLLRLTEPRRLFGGDQPLAERLWLRNRVVDCWRIFQREHRYQECAGPVRQWLDYVETSRDQEPLVLLMKAAGRDARGLGDLYVLARNWAEDRGSVGSMQVLRGVRDRIDIAQGLRGE